MTNEIANNNVPENDTDYLVANQGIPRTMITTALEFIPHYPEHLDRNKYRKVYISNCSYREQNQAPHHLAPTLQSHVEVIFLLVSHEAQFTPVSYHSFVVSTT